MNTKLLQKAIDELKSENPDLSYLRGMLETMMDMQEESNLDFNLKKEIVLAKLEGRPPVTPASLTAAEQAAQAAETGFITGTKPGVDIPVLNSGN